MQSSSPRAQRFFTKYASGYSNNPDFSRGPDLAALLDELKPGRTEEALDVATGTGFTALALAPFVKSVVGIDITEGMLQEARRIADERGSKNVTFELGDAQKLAYPNSSFDIVTTRRAAHHFDDVPAFLRGARRVIRLEGRLGVVDMSPPPGAADFTNRIEKLRDASHIRAFDQNEWGQMLNEAGFEISSERIMEESVSLGDWLYPVRGGGDEEDLVRRAWKAVPAKVSGLLKADIIDGVIRGWTKRRIVIVASPETP